MIMLMMLSMMMLMKGNKKKVKIMNAINTKAQFKVAFCCTFFFRFSTTRLENNTFFQLSRS